MTHSTSTTITPMTIQVVRVEDMGRGSLKGLCRADDNVWPWTIGGKQVSGFEIHPIVEHLGGRVARDTRSTRGPDRRRAAHRVRARRRPTTRELADTWRSPPRHHSGTESHRSLAVLFGNFFCRYVIIRASLVAAQAG